MTADHLAVPFRDPKLEGALRQAREEGRLAVAEYRAAWSPPSPLLRAIETRPRLAERLRRLAIVVRVDGEADSIAGERLVVDDYPAVLAFSGDGAVLLHVVGAQALERFLARLEDAATGAQSGPRARFADALDRIRHAGSLAEAGRGEEALEHYLWAYDRDLAREAGAQPLRLTFLPGEIALLGEDFRPARRALRERRAAARRALLAGHRARGAAARLVALDAALGEPQRSLALFDRLRSLRGSAAPETRALADRVAPLLMRARRYDDLFRSAGRSAAWLRGAMVRAGQRLESRWACAVVEGRLCGEVAHALGRSDEAAEIERCLREHLPPRVAFACLIDAAREAGRAGVTEELVRRAGDELPARVVARLRLRSLRE